MSEPTVFIVDDDPSARGGVSRLVRAAGLSAESFPSAQSFLESGRTEGPGCIVLDVRMKGKTGPELQEELCDAEYCMPIIFLSGFGDVPTAARAFKNGAVDFLTKPVDKDDLLNAVHGALAQDAEYRAERVEKSSVQESIGTLTPREHEVMTYLITGALNKWIAAELRISEATVKIHRRHVMEKMGIRSVAELVRLCERVGIAPAERSR